MVSSPFEFLDGPDTPVITAADPDALDIRGGFEDGRFLKVALSTPSCRPSDPGALGVSGPTTGSRPALDIGSAAMHWYTSDRFADYRKWWDPETWEIVEKFNVAPDGKLNMLMSQNPRTVSRGWIYRKDLLDAQGLIWAKTVDAYFVKLQKLNQAYPSHYPLFTRDSGGIFTDVTEASWRTTAGVHFDTDELVYGAATSEYRTEGESGRHLGLPI